MNFLRTLGELLGLVRVAQDGDARDAEARGRAMRTAGEIARDAEAQAQATAERARGPRCPACRGTGYRSSAPCRVCAGTGDLPPEAP